MNDIESKEAYFHDNWAKSTDLAEICVDKSFESIACPENKQIIKWMKDLRGKKVLELGCGLGEASVYFAKQGAEVTSTDISVEMVKKTESLAAFHGVKVKGVVVSANDLNNLEDGYYDYIYAGNLLHHVDVEKCLSNLYPKLKYGGTAFFWDPIAYNPVINLYRMMATEVRTEDEHPLRKKDLKVIQKIFTNVEFKFFWLSSLMVFIWYAVRGISPNKERYWKRIVDKDHEISGFLKFSQKLDNTLFKMIPFLNLLAWNVVVRAEKVEGK
jgi:2-polyprenyl-3-methyl-5-hydroxy-6-metoxy-1,4-benzoquinol methylase